MEYTTIARIIHICIVKYNDNGLKLDTYIIKRTTKCRNTRS